MAARMLLCGGLFLVVWAISGCQTAEDKSSIPWNRPQPWEKSGIPGVGY